MKVNEGRETIYSVEHPQCVRHIGDAKTYVTPALGPKDKLTSSSDTRGPEPDVHPTWVEPREP